ncbi:MAG: preprotein translocase subunit SecG [Ruminococcaceae bacterium]|nr:preprotein translocase subunit SecG [Oscillospiraceae bacterium]
MTVFEYVMGGLLILMALFLVVAVLLQHGKDHNLSGTIAGGAENFFGKTKGQKIDKKLGRFTTIIACVFVACLLVLYIVQPDMVLVQTNPGDVAPGGNSPYYDPSLVTTETTTAATEDTTAPVEDTTEAAQN